MFLRMLNEKQKELVLGLANKAAEANGIVEESEKELINCFVDEMGLSGAPECRQSTEEICENLVAISSKKDLIRITFEILGIMLGDSHYDQDEKQFMLGLVKRFGLTEELLNEMKTCLGDYYNVIKRMESLTNQ